MGSLILYFLLLLLRVLFNLISDVIHKRNGFSKAFSKKGFEFISSRKSGLVIFDPDFILLLTEINPILEEESYKNDVFITYNPSNFEIVLTLLTTVVVFHVQISKV